MITNQQNLINLLASGIMSIRNRSLSPLSKDPFSIGKLVCRDSFSPIRDTFNHNPEDAPPTLTIFNTKQVGEIISPITHSKMTANQHDRSLQKIQQVTPDQISKAFGEKQKQIMSKDLSNRSFYKTKLGVIRRTPPKQIPTQFRAPSKPIEKSLPEINHDKISAYSEDVHIRSVPSGYFQANKTNKKHLLPTPKRNSDIGYFRVKRDPEEDEKLENKSTSSAVFRISKSKGLRKNDLNNSLAFTPQTNYSHHKVSNNVSMKQRTQKEKEKEKEKMSFTQQVILDEESHSHRNSYSRINPNPANESQTNFKNFEEPHPLSLSNSFIKISSSKAAQSDQMLIIDLRTSISKIKQTLIEGSDLLQVSFRIPEIFFSPPSPATSSSDLHYRMKEIFEQIGISPQIVTIKKYVNCVMMRDKRLCILWYFNGKIYFGGWQGSSESSEGAEHLIKSGVGLEWLPSRYIYYGQFSRNKKEGYGVMKKSNKEAYVGCWKSNEKEGWGKLYGSDGSLQENGQYSGGRLCE